MKSSEQKLEELTSAMAELLEELQDIRDFDGDQSGDPNCKEAPGIAFKGKISKSTWSKCRSWTALKRPWPEKWSIKYIGNNCCELLPMGYRIQFGGGREKNDYDQEDVEIMKLIAAAPELFEQLEATLNRVVLTRDALFEKGQVDFAQEHLEDLIDYSLINQI